MNQVELFDLCEHGEIDWLCDGCDPLLAGVMYPKDEDEQDN